MFIISMNIQLLLNTSVIQMRLVVFLLFQFFLGDSNLPGLPYMADVLIYFTPTFSPMSDILK
jgi:hypothetical protein